MRSGLHNGYTILGGKWSKFLLGEDDSDRDVLRTVDAVLTLAGFSPNEFMALAVMVEYHLGIPGAQVRLAYTTIPSFVCWGHESVGDSCLYVCMYVCQCEN